MPGCTENPPARREVRLYDQPRACAITNRGGCQAQYCLLCSLALDFGQRRPATELLASAQGKAGQVPITALLTVIAGYASTLLAVAIRTCISKLRQQPHCRFLLVPLVHRWYRTSYVVGEGVFCFLCLGPGFSGLFASSRPPFLSAGARSASHTDPRGTRRGGHVVCKTKLERSYTRSKANSGMQLELQSIEKIPTNSTFVLAFARKCCTLVLLASE